MEEFEREFGTPCTRGKPRGRRIEDASGDAPPPPSFVERALENLMEIEKRNDTETIRKQIEIEPTWIRIPARIDHQTDNKSTPKPSQNRQFWGSRGIPGGPGPSWGTPGASRLAWGASWRRFGASWGRLGPSWGRLGAVLGPSGAVLGPSWAVLGPSWGRLGGVLGALGAVLGVLGSVREASWGSPEASRSHFGVNRKNTQKPMENQ